MLFPGASAPLSVGKLPNFSSGSLFSIVKLAFYLIEPVRSFRRLFSELVAEFNIAS